MRFLIPTLTLAFFLALSLAWTTQPPPAVALDDIRLGFHQDLDRWESATVAFASLAPSALDSLRDLHAELRLAYKRTEWLAAYLDEAATKRFINGAPLPTVEPKVPEVRVIEPGGLQLLEEQLYEADLPLATFAKTKHDLLSATPNVVRDLKKRPLTALDVYAAARYGVIRIFTLGVTGFDTPASGRALPEAAVALRGIEAGLRPLLHGNTAIPPALRDSIQLAFSLGQTQLATGTFEAFDRLAFLTTCIDPLYRSLLTAQRAQSIEMPSEQQVLPKGHNYQSNSLFADNFLNDFYYAGQPADDSLFAYKLALGKRLFYDVGLSSTGTLSCASCHDPARGFSDGERKSLGNTGKPLLRNAPTLLGAVYAERYFADLREPTLSRQIRHVVKDAHEFGTDYLTILDSLRQNLAYQRAFDTAYADLSPNYRISTHSLSDALASYVRSLHSHSSPFDAYVRGERHELAEEVRRGFNLFMGKAACGTCHFAPTFAGLVPPFFEESESEVLGVPSRWPVNDTTGVDLDLGRFGSGRPADLAPFYGYSFKTPTVRNVVLTAPYMHNGSMDSLGHVVDFYNAGGGVGLGYDLPYQTLPFDSLSLTHRERQDLVAFMEALTDELPVD